VPETRTYLPRYIDLRVGDNLPLRTAVVELQTKLLAENARLRNGKLVSTPADAVLWFLENELLDKNPPVDPVAQLRISQAKLRSA
jgi:hypothetical protein